ncbi:hypothetical protein SVIO_036600 [Streptomyces violaceusniger]|uniref:Inositolphosphotransferase Aur1/Ipt1 domain-containing protein n=1 Tax=Streptomyces violaceusniger TaxID=68280 RepID=A0A4D4L2W2_STRVO|nr:hypothetical protein SVIO_036600 [Streptomyces violaceusniger]
MPYGWSDDQDHGRPNSHPGTHRGHRRGAGAGPHPDGPVAYPRRPRLWFEIVLIAVSYWTYSLIRNAVPEQRPEALRNANWIWEWEHRLGLAFERGVNHAIDSVSWLIVGMNYYYATLHFIVTLGVLVWLYHWHPGRYAATRLALFATTGVALLGYYFFPLAPPRLMRGGHFIDTVVVHNTWGSMASGTSPICRTSTRRCPRCTSAGRCGAV